ncbi:MAG: YjjG family noncanonical pyrimidine nucleotidase [Flavobacteriales bacterium]
MKYKHLFFDLDGTLWDLYQNTRDAFVILSAARENMHFSEDEFEIFFKRYFHHNEIVWKLYRENKIEKELLRTIRFRRTFDDVGLNVDDDFILRFADDFIETCPKQPHLIEGTLDLLQTMHGKIPMHIITNGFKEVQSVKLAAGGIGHFFENIVNSEDCGIRKPFAGIFDFAMEISGARPEESLMIGDDWEADILGARDYGMDTAWLKTHESRHNYKPHYTVSSMTEMKDILLALQ